MPHFKIEGQNTISGKVTPQGNKNEALPILGALCLLEGRITIENIPIIQDILLLFEILEKIGVLIEQDEMTPTTYHFELNSASLKSDLPSFLCQKLRGVITLLAPILVRKGTVFLPKMGGDKIGRRRIDTHFLALQALGAKFEIFPDGYKLTCDKLKGTDILLDEASVTATENTIMAAVLAEGQTIIRNAASEPHVQKLCFFLNNCGAKIDGIGSNTLIINGVGSLSIPKKNHKISPDYLEVTSFVSLAALTDGELEIEDVIEDDLRMIRLVYEKLGIKFNIKNNKLFVSSGQKRKIVPDIQEAIPKIESSPWPGFPADMTSVALMTATQCDGTVMIHEKMFESRLFFVDHLIAMGAKIVLCDPHRAIVMGKSKLFGQRVASPDIRAGMAILIAALCAKGVSEIHNISQIDRGFQNIDFRLNQLGAKITRVS